VTGVRIVSLGKAGLNGRKFFFLYLLESFARLECGFG
jgi:hypothetical protein